MSNNWEELQWQESVDILRSYIVKVSTPDGHGTGFLIANSPSASILAVVTAAHVVQSASDWEQPIRLSHAATNSSLLLKNDDRMISIDYVRDTATILFWNQGIPFPIESPPLIKEGDHFRVASEIGWLGFPGVYPQKLCFFSGRISAWVEERTSYLVDGVAINGVSGGPAFVPSSNGNYILVGLVSAYIANRATDETLPGLCVIRDVSAVHDAIKNVRSFEEAVNQLKKEHENPPEIAS